MTRTLTLAALALLVLLAGCTVHDPTTAPTPTPVHAQPTTIPPPGADEPATTAATEPAPACPLVLVNCPRPEVTPGAVIPSETGLCTTSYNPRKELTAAAKRRVLHAYGLPADTKVAEYDHLIARWAGGTSDARNTWPAVNAAEKQRKDRLEYGLYLDVCRDHDVSLAVARQRMRAYWNHW